jgi:branched-chain amino acid transport system permease protein
MAVQLPRDPGGDLTRLMVTLGIGLMLFEAANKAAFLTGGVDGLSGVTMNKLLGMFEFDLFGKTAYVYSLVVLFVIFLLVRRLVASPFGLSLRGIREGARRMPALGTDVPARLRAVFTVAAAIAGVAGACWPRPRSLSAWMCSAFRARPNCW